jgi:hypothetical protein
MEVNGQLHAPAALSRERTPGTDWIGGWVSPTAGLDAVEYRNISCLYQESTIQPWLSVLLDFYVKIL